MKLEVVFHLKDLKMPPLCCKCGSKSPPFEWDKVEVRWYSDWSMKRWSTLLFRFPYCPSCLREVQKRMIRKWISRGVDVSDVKTRSHGKFLRKEKVPYIEIDFKNNEFGELFRQLNQDSLLENVLKAAKQ